MNYYEERKRSPAPTVRMPRDIFDDISEKNDEESSGEYARQLMDSYEMDLPDDVVSSNSIMVKQFKFIDKTQDIHGIKNAQMQINIKEYQKIED